MMSIGRPHHAFSTDTDEHDGRIQGGRRAGDEVLRPGRGIREGVHAPLQRRAAEPERAPSPGHPD